MKWGCRSTPSFFVQIPFEDPTHLAQYQFFLVYHGNGYTQSDVDAMSLDVLLAHVERLYNQLNEERRSHEAAARQARKRR
jgi:hypothetical protein